MTSPCLRAHAKGSYLAIKVQPRASKNEIGELMGAELKVKVTAPPVDSAANEAVLRLLADVLRCPLSAIQIAKGQTSRRKTLFVTGLSPEQIEAKLFAKE